MARSHLIFLIYYKHAVGVGIPVVATRCHNSRDLRIRGPQRFVDQLEFAAVAGGSVQMQDRVAAQILVATWQVLIQQLISVEPPASLDSPHLSAMSNATSGSSCGKSGKTSAIVK